MNNQMYGTIRMHQERTYPGRVTGSDLRGTDFAALARGYGAHGVRISKTEDFSYAMEDIIGPQVSTSTLQYKEIFIQKDRGELV